MSVTRQRLDHWESLTKELLIIFGDRVLWCCQWFSDLSFYPGVEENRLAVELSGAVSPRNSQSTGRKQQLSAEGNQFIAGPTC